VSKADRQTSKPLLCDRRFKVGDDGAQVRPPIRRTPKRLLDRSDKWLIPRNIIMSLSWSRNFTLTPEEHCGNHRLWLTKSSGGERRSSGGNKQAALP
jgi:hypothetical protein